jgi:regulator of sigma E protease
MFMTVLSFFFAMLLLIIVHEFGHFIVARWCGVKVLRFSFGFGKILWSTSDKYGTEYAWSLFPIGGYVKMLDESLGPVAAEDRHLAFNNKPLWARVAVVLAGPVFNFLFAFLVLWLVLVVGINSLAPIIQNVKPGSIAARAQLRAHEEIISLAGDPTRSWREVQFALMPLIGANDGAVNIVTRSLTDGSQKSHILILKDLHLAKKQPDVIDSLGIEPFIPVVPPVVGEVVPGSPAAVAGFRAGDIVHGIDGRGITDWLEVVSVIKKHPNHALVFEIIRQAKFLTIHVNVLEHTTHGKQEGFVGMRSKAVDWPRGWFRYQRENPLKAIGVAFKQTIGLTHSTMILMARLVLGKLPLDTMSGPIGIAEGAGASARSGLPYYLSFLGLVSISLGVLNLLPIPMLDGGHLLFFLFEAIRRRPLSEASKSIAISFGLILLITLMLIALSNDLTRLT